VRIARMLLICSTLLFPLAVHAQTFEQLTFLRVNELPMSVRAQSMGAVSIDDFALNPAHAAGVKSMQFSLAGARASYDLLDIVALEPNFFTSRYVNVEKNDLSQVSLLVPVRSVVVGLWHRNDPQLSGLRAIPIAGYGEWTASQCLSEAQYCTPFLFAALSPSFEREDKRYGASIAFERGAFAFGASAELQQLDERVSLQRTRFQIEPALMDRIVRRTSGSEIVPTVGVRWKASPKITIAAAYNGGGTYKTTNDACYAAGDACASAFGRIGASETKMPDAIRASLAYKPLENVQLVGEVVRRNYSGLGTLDASLFNGEAIAVPTYDDVLELHAGAEYKISRVALRAGWWRDPARISNDLYQDYNLGQDHEHVTFGAGFDFGGGRVDVAFDDPDDDVLRRASVGVTFSVPSL
jgi:hypothetical protein